jgi:hypothetical protein
MATASKSGDKPVKAAAKSTTKPAAKTASKPKTAKTETAVKAKAVKKPAVAKAEKVAPAAKKTPTKAATPATKTAAATAGKPNAIPVLTPEQRCYYVEVAAYYIAERRGFHGGGQLNDWVLAEEEIDRLLREGILKP